MSKSRTSVLVAVLLLTLSCGNSLHAVDMFMDIAGIPGESTDPAHTNQVDVLAWSWGLSQSGTAQTGGGGTGKATFQDLSFTKYTDKASPRLMSSCSSGSQISLATLYVRKPGTIPVEYLQIQVSNVVVTSVSTGGSGGEDRLTENVTLNFEKLKVDYLPTNPDGSVGGRISFRWDIALNQGMVLGAVEGLKSTLTYSNGAPFARLTWNSIAGANYQVWATADLKTAFQKYGGTTASAGDGTTSILVPENAIKMFFRIETVSGP